MFVFLILILNGDKALQFVSCRCSAGDGVCHNGFISRALYFFRS